MTDEDRQKGGQNSHEGQGSGKNKDNSNLTDADRKRGGENSHGGQSRQGYSSDNKR